MSEREPELGLGVVAHVDPAAKRITVAFPATGEKRIYALGTAVLRRVVFRAGESITTRKGDTLTIDGIETADGLLRYASGVVRVREDEISDVMNVGSPAERLLLGQTDPSEVFDLRLRARQMQARIRQSDVRGFLGGRVELIPHQFYILQEVARRQLPRVLLADEVGLGKTIEACLILQRLLAVGRVQRALVLVPESLTHQWFVELLRRFNLWFSIYGEERCVALEESDPAENPFLATQLALCSVAFLAGNPARREQALAAGWDLVVVDEAHHLAWSPEAASPEYELVEQLGRRSPGLLLLTATPTQLGQAGHFARLRLLDPDRYSDYATFLRETERFTRVAAIAEKIVERKRLQPADARALAEIYNRDPERLQEHLRALAGGAPGAAEALLQSLLDQHGIGRVMFRNTRAAMSGFPKRAYCPAPLMADGQPALVARVARELQAEETGTEGEIRYSYRDDPRLDWLAGLLREQRTGKVLLICRSQRKAAAIEAALQEKMKAKSALFHEGLPLVQRDRNAAWFAEPDGAQLLICSEIGSEGRNFQFAHHLVLFDLPLNPGLVEQRIGRLDRIGQTQTIRIHVPYLIGTAEECVVEWYHRGLDAFERPLHGGTEFQDQFKAQLLELATGFSSAGPRGRQALNALIKETTAFRRELDEKMRKGRDRLLELNSFNGEVAAAVIERIRAADQDPALRQFLLALLDHFGVRIREHEDRDVSLDPSHAYIEAFPSIPADGMLGTFDRRRALAREDVTFLTADHSLVRDAMDLLLDSPAGTTAFGVLASRTPNLLLEAVFVLEAVAESRWHVDQFLAPTPIRVVVDLRGRDLSEERDIAALAGYVVDADLHRFLERPGFTAASFREMVDAGARIAAEKAAALRKTAALQVTQRLGAELQRLRDLQKINDHVRPEELTLAQTQLERTVAAVDQARLRLDAVRLVIEGAVA